MKVKVNQEKCMSCGSCPSLVPEVFEFDDEGLAFAKDEVIEEDLEDAVKEAIEFCPTKAISEVKEESKAN